MHTYLSFSIYLECMNNKVSGALRKLLRKSYVNELGAKCSGKSLVWPKSTRLIDWATEPANKREKISQIEFRKNKNKIKRKTHKLIVQFSCSQRQILQNLFALGAAAHSKARVNRSNLNICYIFKTCKTVQIYCIYSIDFYRHRFVAHHFSCIRFTKNSNEIACESWHKIRIGNFAFERNPMPISCSENFTHFTYTLTLSLSFMISIGQRLGKI